MALELIRSEVKLSFDVPRLDLTCMWECDGVQAYSAVICDPPLLHNTEFWNYMETQVARWYANRPRKQGEIVCLPTFQST